MDEVASDEVLDLAYDWLCRSRKNAGHNSDVWVVRWRWADLKPRVQAELRAGTYRLSPTERYVIDGEAIDGTPSAVASPRQGQPYDSPGQRRCELGEHGRRPG